MELGEPPRWHPSGNAWHFGGARDRAWVAARRGGGTAPDREAEGKARRRRREYEARQIKALERTKDNSAHLLSLINDLLDVNKVESGTQSLELGPVNVAGLCDGIIEMLSSLAAPRICSSKAASTTARRGSKATG